MNGNFNEMSFVINFRIDLWLESVLSITSSQKCSFIHFVISIVKLISLYIHYAIIGIGGELRNESIACRPCSINFVYKLLREVLDFCAAHILLLSFLFFLPFTMRSGFTFSNFIKEKTHQNLAF